MAHAAKEIGATLVHISTDFVFDGEKTKPYIEDDSVNPQSAYGRTKAFGEQAIIESDLKNILLFVPVGFTAQVEKTLLILSSG